MDLGKELRVIEIEEEALELMPVEADIADTGSRATADSEQD
ncbi:MAG: hypothetical protein WAL25_08880 [Acidimicrobiia bacterium]